MPWKETSTLEECKQLIARWKRGEDSLAELCRAYGFSRQTACKSFHRFAE
jgi:hypothetical protein